MMKAAYFVEKGPAQNIRFGELPTPQPGPGQVRVRILASAVNPIDTYVRSGKVSMDLPFPLVPGCDLAGEIDEVGEGVASFRKGDRVWGSNQGVYGRQGTLAEYAVVDEAWLYPLPPGMDPITAAAGALTGITAHLGLFSVGKLKANEVVFVNGGTGGVGSAVVQLAKAAGAIVITTVGSREKQAQCLAWGADRVLDYHAADIDDQIRKFSEAFGGIQLWFETQRELSFDRIISLMADHGRIILMAGGDQRPALPIGPFYFKDLRLLGLLMMKTPSGEQRQSALAINELASQGKWHPPVGKIFPLAEAAAAHELQESGASNGKIVVVP